MKKLISKLTPVQWLAVTLIVLGALIMVPRVKGMLEFYKEVRYAQKNDFAAGNPSPDLIRPWMSLRYIAAAYGVPQKYLYEAAGIQPRKETSMIGLNRLNAQLGLGNMDGGPALMGTIREAIIAYRASPVSTGLLEQHVEDWMTAQYIANSTGIPVETILEEAGIPPDGNAYKPLGFLSDELDYPGGRKTLLGNIQKIVDSQVTNPELP